MMELTTMAPTMAPEKFLLVMPQWAYNVVLAVLLSINIPSMFVYWRHRKTESLRHLQPELITVAMSAVNLMLVIITHTDMSSVPMYLYSVAAGIALTCLTLISYWLYIAHLHATSILKLPHGRARDSSIFAHKLDRTVLKNVHLYHQLVKPKVLMKYLFVSALFDIIPHPIVMAIHPRLIWHGRATYIIPDDYVYFDIQFYLLDGGQIHHPPADRCEDSQHCGCLWQQEVSETNGHHRFNDQCCIDVPGFQYQSDVCHLYTHEH